MSADARAQERRLGRACVVVLIALGALGGCEAQRPKSGPRAPTAAAERTRAEADPETTGRAREAARDANRDRPLRAPWGGLQVAERGDGDRAVVLLHGYGARGDDLVDFANRLVAEVPQTLFVIPSAPLTRSFGDGRAWFEPPASAIDGSDARREAQREIDDARERLEGVIDTLRGRGIAPGRVIVAGFSQGAMMSLDLALRAEVRVRGVGLLSGAPLPGWGFERARGLAVFASHGTRDDILPFADADALRTRLQESGAEVAWSTFEGGHAIPPAVREDFARWLRSTLE